jgi:hypothetical protein
MQTFISDTISSILSKQSSFENAIFILPSQRAGVFVKQELKQQLTAGFLPTILNIEQFIEDVSNIQKIDTVQLLFHFYSVYKGIEKEADDFDNFFSWAITAIQDFNEIDQHLVNQKELFTYLRDIERLKNWSVKKPIAQTNMMDNHFSFIEKLGNFYQAFYSFLLNKKIGYQGLIYREAVNNIDNYSAKNSNKKFYFIGFNALNKAEEQLFQIMLSQGNTEVYWDIDSVFLNSNHQAGSFIRKYKNEWKYYLTHQLQTVSSNFKEEKNIHVIGASKNISQIKYAGELLNSFDSYNNTAYVLADESLLPIALNSLPKKVDAINITMGYPLKDIPTTSLFSSIFQLFINQEKLQKTSLNQFYFKDVIEFLKHPAIQPLLVVDSNSILNNILQKITVNNNAFISIHLIESYLTHLESDTKLVLTKLFSPFENTLEFIERILNLITLLKDRVSSLDKEFLFRFYTTFSQIKSLQLEYNYLKNIKTIQQLFLQVIQSDSLSFKGEPLQGLQLMGMLETRSLDFENIIITSVNENVLPKGNSQSSFIPFDVKLDFNLPTYKEKDAIFSYHFFRLLQRAKNIYLLYNSESDTFGGGEKSRFISQLILLKNNIKETIVSPKVISETVTLKEIFKNNQIQSKLEELAQKGFSPSTLTNYLYNPFSFYEQKILGLKEYQEVEETVAMNTMGTIIHNTLEDLYKPYVGKVITENTIKKMLIVSDDLIASYFKKHFNNSDVYTGKNRIIFEISKDYVQRFLKSELKLASNNSLKIIATEQDLEATIRIDEFDFPIKIKGQVDRIDELNGITRIIDYKTGKAEARDLKIKDVTNIIDEKYNKAIQVLLYAFLYQQNYNKNSLESGIISFKNLKSGLLKVDFGRNQHEITTEIIEAFMQQIKELIKEIFNQEIPFTEKVHEKKW